MKRLIGLMVAAASVAVANAIPANPMPGVCQQPDGTSVTLRLVGDEFYHYNCTSDGYTVLRNSATGAYEYARLDGAGRLSSTGVLAHDAARRTPSEMSLLAITGKHVTDRVASTEGTRARRARDEQGGLNRIKQFDYDKFRGLIILINYSDIKIEHADIYEDMVNKRGYTGYDQSNVYGRFTGSVCDYYRENSMGNFDPQFDIYGPVDVTNYASTQGNASSRSIFQTAIRLLDNEIDYSQYDTDGDGYVDMVYFIVAGYGSNTQNNDSRLLWPYKSGWLTNNRFDGKRFNLYACSTALMGQEGSGVPDGIGTICHEFTHVLGFPDLYDTNYETGGQSHDPGKWDIMASGGYNNYSRTPAGYSLFERYTFEWAAPQVITEAGEYSIEPLQTGNSGYKLPTAEDSREFFLIENRQATRWDAALPGHGMVVVRVDSTNVAVWNNNTLNCDPNHNYYELLRAGGSTEGDKTSDPFPGTDGVLMLDNSGVANLCSWAGVESPFVITDIDETTGGAVTFRVIKAADQQVLVEDFEEMPVNAATPLKGVQGRWATWTLNKANVMAGEEGVTCNGAQSMGMYTPSMIQMETDLDYRLTMVRANVFNSSAAAAKLRLYVSYDGGKTWKDPASDHTVSIAGSAIGTVMWKLNENTDKPVRLRINMTAGSKVKTSRLYIDDLRLYHNGKQEAEPSLKGDVNNDGVVDVGDVNAVLAAILTADSDTKYDVNDDGSVDVGDVNTILDIILNNNSQP
ncbi:MAG: M6 family metalloprotease domain-containing protein [Muribaculaceae bacterium]|nr:M6 family metalloprotease domain-containing protein [Muribaculaceae bacterium]